MFPKPPRFSNFLVVNFTFSFTFTASGTHYLASQTFWNIGESIFNLRTLTFCMHLRWAPCWWYQGLRPADAVVRVSSLLTIGPYLIAEHYEPDCWEQILYAMTNLQTGMAVWLPPFQILHVHFCQSWIWCSDTFSSKKTLSHLKFWDCKVWGLIGACDACRPFYILWFLLSSWDLLSFIFLVHGVTGAFYIVQHTTFQITLLVVLLLVCDMNLAKSSEQ